MKMNDYSESDQFKRQVEETFLAKKSSKFDYEFDYESNFVINEWVQIASNKVIVATANGAWLHFVESEEDSLREPMEHSGSVVTTRKLLDGAIAAAKCAVKSNVRPPELSETRWIWRLAGAYHLSHLVPQLMMEASQKFALTKCSLLEQWAIDKAKEETNHDLLALRDIQALGYNAEAVVETLVPPTAVALIDYLKRSVRDRNPIDCVGYSYTMERLAMGVGKDYIQKIEELLPENIHATRYLRVHSSIGADAEHTDETVEVVASLSAKERTRVTIACYETALMCFSPPSQGYVPDLELDRAIKFLRD
jgi:hypothetical protein